MDGNLKGLGPELNGLNVSCLPGRSEVGDVRNFLLSGLKKDKGASLGKTMEAKQWKQCWFCARVINMGTGVDECR